jgi:hypothetical protein
VLLDRSRPGVQPNPHPEDHQYNNDLDWTELADAAMENADLDIVTHLPSPPDVVNLTDDDDADEPSPLPSSFKQTLRYIPKLEPDSTPAPAPTVAPTTPSQPSRYPARVCAPPKHLDQYHLFTTVADDSSRDPSYPYTNAAGDNVDLAIKDEVLMAHACHYVMTHTANKLFLNTQPLKKQYGLKSGLRLFGNKGEAAIRKELTQFHTLKCFVPKDPSTLTREERRIALSSLMFLTEKRDGEVKARTCANGSTQCQHIAKEEATAPTVTTEAIFIQSTIFAHEHRDVATCDIRGAFLHADNPDYVLMRLDGILAELMVKVAPNIYRKHVTTNSKGKPVLYNQLEKAVYGMMKRALLFYCKLVADLLSIGFTINPYDPCIANKMVDGNQLTICWHVDDLLLGHADKHVVSRFLTWLSQRYDTPDKKSRPPADLLTTTSG